MSYNYNGKKFLSLPEQVEVNRREIKNLEEYMNQNGYNLFITNKMLNEIDILNINDVDAYKDIKIGDLVVGPNGVARQIIDMTSITLNLSSDSVLIGDLHGETGDNCDKYLKDVKKIEIEVKDLETRTTFLENQLIGTNLFDLSNAKVGYYITDYKKYNCLTQIDFIYTSSPNMVSTPLIEVTGGKDIYLRLGTSSLGCLIEYDKNGNYLHTHKSIVSELVDGFSLWTETITLQENTKYILASNNKVNLDIDFMAISYNEIPNGQLLYGYPYLVNSSPLYGKRIAYFGDSLMYGLEVNYNGFGTDVIGGIWQRLNDTYSMVMTANESLGGSTIQRSSDTNTDSIATRMYNFDNTNTDIVLFTGGFNDTYQYVAGSTVYDLGTINTDYNTYLPWNSLVNCLQNAIIKLKERNPNCIIVWIKTWSNSTNDYLDNTFETIEKLCKKWNVPVVNLYEEATFTLRNNSDRLLCGRRNYTSETTYDSDYTHVGPEGYDRSMPMIIDVLERSIKK